MVIVCCFLLLMVFGVHSCPPENCGCSTSLNVQLSGTDASQCTYVFSIPANNNGQCPPLRKAVRQLCKTYNIEDRLQNGIIGYYPFDKDTLDYSGNERDGVVSGGGISYENGVKRKAAKFSGNVKVVADDFKNFDFGSTFSVSVWFKRTSTTSYQGIVNNGYFQTGSWEIRMGIEFSGRMLGGGVVTSSSDRTWDYINLIAEVNEWHHVVMTYDGSKLLYYLDGQQQTGDDDCCSGPILVRNTPVTIGQAGPGKSNEFFVGLIDEVRLYSIALTEDDVEYLYNYIDCLE